MRVVVPYTVLSQGCAQCLDRHAPHAERVYVGGDVLDYWRLLCRVWADGEDFILIEHDVVFGADAIEILETCLESWCTVADFFRLTRFRARLIADNPDAFAALPYSLRHWIPLEWYAACRNLPPTGGIHKGAEHRHFGEADTYNGLRGLNGTDYAGLYTSAGRRPVWFAWLRTLSAEHADKFTAKAWAEVTDDGRACSLASCSRAQGYVIDLPGFGPYRGHVCERCRNDGAAR